MAARKVTGVEFHRRSLAFKNIPNRRLDALRRTEVFRAPVARPSTAFLLLPIKRPACVGLEAIHDVFRLAIGTDDDMDVARTNMRRKKAPTPKSAHFAYRRQHNRPFCSPQLKRVSDTPRLPKRFIRFRPTRTWHVMPPVDATLLARQV
jgi:hypothetical protein